MSEQHSENGRRFRKLRHLIKIITNRVNIFILFSEREKPKNGGKVSIKNTLPFLIAWMMLKSP